mgnify:FL=1
MLDILAITGPIYLCIALGWLATRAGLFARADMRVLGQFVLYIALPALLFSAVGQRPLADILDWHYMAVFALGGVATIGFGLFWTRRVARQAPLAGVVQAMGMTCPNSGFVGYPINLLVLGAPAAGVILGMNMLVENLLLIPLLLALADSAGGGGHWRGVLRGVAVGLWRNPLVLGLAVGLAASLLGLRLPQPVERTVGLLAQSSAALSLFVIGGSLAGLRLAGMGRTVARIAAGKLLVHPLLTVGALALLAALGTPLADPALKKGVVLATACPMFGIYPILAGRFGEEGLAAAALLGTTVASFFSISALLWWLG